MEIINYEAVSTVIYYMERGFVNLS